MPLRLSLVGLAFALAPGAAPADEPAKVNFARDVLPILSDTCFACHGPDAKSRKADLRLDLKDEAHGSGTIVPGKHADSELIRRIVSTDPTEVMPPAKGAKKLTPQQIDTLKKWIDQGAPWGRHWAFDAPQRPAVPKTKHATANAIDAFVRQRLEREKIAPAAPATKEQLIRRVTLDLTGLPPTPAEVEAFVGDAAPDAFEKVVDRLLASPRYGERMAWDWLEAARYADSNGYQGDNERTMWPWRDWVVQAFNRNMRYDDFTRWQLAGDLLPNATREQVLATGFNRNHMINGEGGRIPEENRVEYVFDQAETVGTLWLGLTLTCSRCHDHKFDPISKRDYYRLFAYFNQTPVSGGGGSGQTAPVIDFSTPEQDQRLKAAQKALDETVGKIAPVEKKLRDDAAITTKDGKYESKLPAVIESALRKGPNGRADQNNDELAKHFEKSEPAYVALLKDYRKRKGERDAAASAIPKVMVMGDMPKGRDTFVLTRGAYDKKEDKVTPGIPEVFQSPGTAAPGLAPNRLGLAQWVTAKENPLTARVTVNRVWQTFFGTGLVKTSEDFGVQGERPSHPELLDWLAVEFVENGWDMKRLVRLIVTSQTYRQASKATDAQRERDPENRLLARGPRHRLPSWVIRDQALFASGLMTPTVGGTPVRTYQPPGIWEEATFGFKRYQQDTGPALYRRSLYVFWRRIVGPTMFFDVASRQTCSVKTTTTNTPLHALTTLNDTTFVEAARALAQRAMTEAGNDDAARLRVAFRHAVGRAPTATEVEILRGSLERQRRLYAGDRPAAERLLRVGESPRDVRLDVVEHAALTAVCTLIFNLDEVLTNQ